MVSFFVAKLVAVITAVIRSSRGRRVGLDRVIVLSNSQAQAVALLIL